MANQGKVLGRTSGSLNAPIAAFTMAIVLCSYCFSSIRSARREAANPPASAANPTLEARSPLHARSKPSPPAKSEDWVQRALEESRQAEGRKGA